MPSELRKSFDGSAFAASSIGEITRPEKIRPELVEANIKTARAKAHADVSGRTLTPREKIILASLPDRAGAVIDVEPILVERRRKEQLERQNFFELLHELDEADRAAGRVWGESADTGAGGENTEYEIPPGILLTPAKQKELSEQAARDRREFIEAHFDNALGGGALLLAFWKLREAYQERLPAATCERMRGELLAVLDRLLEIPEGELRDARFAEVFRRDLEKMRDAVLAEKFNEGDFDVAHSPTEAQKENRVIEYRARFDAALDLGKLDTAYAYFQWAVRERVGKDQLEDMRTELLWAIGMALDKSDRVLSAEMYEHLDNLREATVRLV